MAEPGTIDNIVLHSLRNAEWGGMALLCPKRHKERESFLPFSGDPKTAYQLPMLCAERVHALHLNKLDQ